MKLPRRNFLHLVAGAAALPVISRFAWAQTYPTRPVRLIAPFAAGGTSGVMLAKLSISVRAMFFRFTPLNGLNISRITL